MEQILNFWGMTMAYTKPQVIAQNASTGSYAAGCPTSGRYIDALNYLLLVLKNRAIYFLSSFFILMILMFITSTLMYFVEHDAQPDVFENAFSGMWWSIVTFTTVGYGDLYPVTLAGKILGGIVSLLGIGLVAVPTGIITSGFMELHSADKEKLDEKSDLEKELAKLKQISKVELILKESKGE